MLENKSMTNMARCIIDSSDKTNISRFLSDAKWNQTDLNRCRLAFMLSETVNQRRKAKNSVLPIDDTMCEHVGNLFDHVDRHYNHTNKSYPLAHNLVTAHYVSGAVRFPVDYRLYRRYEEFTNWESFVHKHFPDTEIPKKTKERNKFRKKIEATLLLDNEFAVLHEAFETKITMAGQLIEYAIEQNLPFETVLFDSWYLSSLLLETLDKHNKKWITVLKTNRNIATASLHLKDEEGTPIRFEKDKIQVKDFVPLIPKSAFKPEEIDGVTYYCFTKNLSLPSLGKVRLVISFDNPECKGRYVVLATNYLSWDAKKIIATYLLRWPIETFYQDCKQQLGLDEYRMRSADAIGKHWALLFVAYSFLHLDCLSKSNGKLSTSPDSSIGTAVRRQQKTAMESLILFAHNLLQAGNDAKEVFETLFAKQSLSLA